MLPNFLLPDIILLCYQTGTDVILHFFQIGCCSSKKRQNKQTEAAEEEMDPI